MVVETALGAKVNLPTTRLERFFFLTVILLRDKNKLKALKL